MQPIFFSWHYKLGSAFWHFIWETFQRNNKQKGTKYVIFVGIDWSIQYISSHLITSIYFFDCRDRHPSLASELGQFKQSLLDASDAMAPLKVWQLQSKSILTNSGSFQISWNLKGKNLRQNPPHICLFWVLLVPKLAEGSKNYFV